VNTNTNNSTVNSTSNNNNTNTNTSTSTVDQNVNSNSTSNNTNTNNNTSNSTSNNTNSNTNTNKNESTSTSDSNVTTNNKNENTNTNKNENINKTDQTIKQEITTKAPPASAIAPSIGSSYSQDLCTTGISGAFQGQIFGLSGGKSVRDMNCERIKLSKTVYDMGMKVAAVSLMCQDERVFDAMEMAGTPCPYYGKIGNEAKVAWEENADERPDKKAYLEGLKPTRAEKKAEKKRKKQEAKDEKAENKRIAAAIQASEDKMNKELKNKKNAFIARCSEEPNPTRERIKNDVVGAIDSIITPKTKTNGQCAKEWESLNI
jgi:hypothetical protein